MSKLHDFCFNTPLKVFGISLAISIVFFLALTFAQTIKTDVPIFGNGLLGFFFIGCSLLDSICSFTVCLNLYKTVRNNLILSLLSFYAPLLIAPFTLVLISSKVVYSEFYSILIPWLFLSLPFLIPQTYFFIKFRRRMRNGEITDDFYYIVSDDKNN